MALLNASDSAAFCLEILWNIILITSLRSLHSLHAIKDESRPFMAITNVTLSYFARKYGYSCTFYPAEVWMALVLRIKIIFNECRQLGECRWPWSSDDCGMQINALQQRRESPFKSSVSSTRREQHSLCNWWNKIFANSEAKVCLTSILQDIIIWCIKLSQERE